MNVPMLKTGAIQPQNCARIILVGLFATVAMAMVMRTVAMRMNVRPANTFVM